MNINKTPFSQKPDKTRAEIMIISAYHQTLQHKLHILQRGCPQSARETSVVGLDVDTRYPGREVGYFWANVRVSRFGGG